MARTRSAFQHARQRGRSVDQRSTIGQPGGGDYGPFAERTVDGPAFTNGARPLR